MYRNERNLLQRLFQAVHTGTEMKALSATWRSSVMADIARLASATGDADELERLAPRFALAAAVISITTLATATLSLGGMSSPLFSTHLSQTLNWVPMIWSSL